MLTIGPNVLPVVSWEGILLVLAIFIVHYFHMDLIYFVQDFHQDPFIQDRHFYVTSKSTIRYQDTWFSHVWVSSIEYIQARY